MTDAKILISIPCRDLVSVRFIECLMSLIKPCECYYRFCASGLVFDARDEACSVAVNSDYTHVLFIDSDMAFEPGALVKALKHNDDVVTGLYYKRKDNHEPVLYKAIDQRRYSADGHVKQHGYAEIETDLDRDYFPVEGCGFGFVLVKLDVLREVHKHHVSWFEPIPGMGEDLSFCQRLKELGIKIMCDTTIKLGHYGEYCFTAKDWVPEDNDGIKIEWNKSVNKSS